MIAWRADMKHLGADMRGPRAHVPSEMRARSRPDRPGRSDFRHEKADLSSHKSYFRPEIHASEG